MSFDIDKQTLRDLELFQEKRTDKSIYSVYNQAATIGGQALLYEMFHAPVSDLEFLQNRKYEINFFFKNGCYIKLNSRQMDFIEYYLRIQRVPLRDNIIDAAYDGLSNKINPSSDYYIISEGIIHIIRLLIDLELFRNEAKSLPIPATLYANFDKIKTFTFSKKIKQILSNPPEQAKDLSFAQINKLDHFFRVSNKNPLREILIAVYKIDVLQTLSTLMRDKGFTIPEYYSESQLIFEVTDAFHPFLTDPISNSFSFNRDSNMCFITGPNMSGKSTFLRTMGLMVYLSHLGFPVPANSLRISLIEGLFSTINLTDNLNLGYSHFYNEVKRVKEIAIKINTKKNLVIIFDELFRGTNVKDAFDASLMIISALSRIRHNFFFISTHIIEAAEDIVKKDSILFRCFESALIDQKPVYDYRLKEGITKERIGMLILKNENIIEILNEIIQKQNKVERF